MVMQLSPGQLDRHEEPAVARELPDAGGDTTCGNWTKSGEGSAIVGHHDRAGLKPTRHMQSWNSSHGTRGCSQDQLKSTGGAGLIYCFVAN
jgi:hypothetical protein